MLPIDNHSIGPSFLVILTHSEDVWNLALVTYSVFILIICMDHIVSIIRNMSCRLPNHRWLWIVWVWFLCVFGFLHCTILVKWKLQSTGLHVGLGCFLWIFLVVVTFIYFNLFSIMLFLDWLTLVLSDVSEFWMFSVVYTQITAKRLSLLVTRKQRPDLFLNGLGRHKTWKKGKQHPGLQF